MEIVISKKKNRKVKHKKKLIIFLSVFILIILLVWLFLKYNVYPVLFKVSNAKVTQTTSGLVNDAVSDAIVNYDCTALVNIEKNTNGEISVITTNSSLVNKILQNVVKTCLQSIKAIGDEGVNVPIGSLSGIPLLMEKGPSIKVKFLPIGTINYSCDTQFTQTGINQTLHKIIVNISADVSLIFANKSKLITVENSVLLSETVIVGKVPNIYLQK